ncbi:MAG: FAD-binding oxidoreductase, partial [Gaiellales bacterium]
MPDADRIHAELAALIGSQAVLPGSTARFLHDATELRSLRGRADAVALPADAGQTAAVMRWCYERGVAVVPRGGGTGFAGGAVPLDGGVVLCTERMTRVRAFDPLLWRIEVEAGVTTAQLRRLVRESGLWFPPDPGAAESSQVGGNIATNAGGPHAFKYGATGAWVTGLEAVVPPGDVIRIGGATRKDVAGYDLMHLLIGSEGTLAVITAAWLRLIPAPEAALPLVGFYGSVEQGCSAIGRIMGSGVVAAALEYLDAGALRAAASTFPGGIPDGAGFAVLTEADGGHAEAAAGREALLEAL